MNNQTPLLSVRNLKTHFFMDEGVVKAVDGVTFDVNAGQVFGIVGESGCGKSVTMKAVLRIVDPPGKIVGGEILLNRAKQNGASGNDLVDLVKLDANSKEMRDIRGAEIALIPQEPMASFSPVHTVGDQIVEAIMLHQKVDRREARKVALQMFKDVGIPIPEQRLDEYSWQLSGGLRQRAIIAMALSCNPRLLIADEPTTAVDVTTQAQVLRLLRRLQGRRAGLALALDCLIATRMERTPLGFIERMRNRAGDRRQVHARRHRHRWNRTEQRLRVRMLGRVKDRVYGTLFHHETQVHDHDMIRHLRDHTQVVGDENNRGVALLLQAT